MKSAVFALLFSSSFAQMIKEGSKEWNEIMEMHDRTLKTMEKKGMPLATDLRPRSCRQSRDCPMQFRNGGCCARARVTKGAENMNQTMRDVFEENKDGAYCAPGSWVDAVRNKDLQGNIYEIERQMYDSDPVVRATWN